jgi:hypothetical protein
LNYKKLKCNKTWEEICVQNNRTAITVDSLVYASPTYAGLMKLSHLCEIFLVPSIAYTRSSTVLKNDFFFGPKTFIWPFYNPLFCVPKFYFDRFFWIFCVMQNFTPTIPPVFSIQKPFQCEHFSSTIPSIFWLQKFS